MKLTEIPPSRVQRILAFDIENKPGTYGPGDYTHPKVTAIGWQFLDRKRVRGLCFCRSDRESMVVGAEEFRQAWDAADIVMGHNIRRHDRKILDGFYLSLELPLLAPKLMCDTYLDMPKTQGLSRSLENLADRWGSPIQKLHLSEYAWEQAYDGNPKFMALMHRRVTTDVRINVWLYYELIERKLLK